MIKQTEIAARFAAILETVDIEAEREALAAIEVAIVQDRKAVERGHERTDELRAQIRLIDDAKVDHRAAADALRRGDNVLEVDHNRQELLDEIQAIQNGLRAIGVDQTARDIEKQNVQSAMRSTLYSAMKPLIDEIGVDAIAALNSFLDHRAMSESLAEFCGYVYGAAHHTAFSEIALKARKTQEPSIVKPRDIDQSMIDVMEASGLPPLVRGWIKRVVELPIS